jgi:hypothetical protein
MPSTRCAEVTVALFTTATMQQMPHWLKALEPLRTSAVQMHRAHKQMVTARTRRVCRGTWE